LAARYGSAAAIVLRDVSGVEESFATADRGLRIVTEGHPAHFDRLGDGVAAFRNREIIWTGAELCCITDIARWPPAAQSGSVLDRPSRRKCRRT